VLTCNLANIAYYFSVDDENVLRQLATEIASGKLKLSELKSLDIESMGRRKRRKHKPEMADDEAGSDTDSEVCSILLFPVYCLHILLLPTIPYGSGTRDQIVIIICIPGPQPRVGSSVVESAHLWL